MSAKRSKKNDHQSKKDNSQDINSLANSISMAFQKQNERLSKMFAARNNTHSSYIPNAAPPRELFSAEDPEFFFIAPRATKGPGSANKPCWICGENGHWLPTCPWVSRLEIIMFILNSFYRYNLNKNRPDKEKLSLKEFFSRDNVPFPSDVEMKMVAKIYEPLQNNLQRKSLGANPKAYCHYCHASGHFTRYCKTYCCYCTATGHSWETCTNSLFVSKIAHRKESIAKHNKDRHKDSDVINWIHDNQLSACYINVESGQRLFHTNEFFDPERS